MSILSKVSITSTWSCPEAGKQWLKAWSLVSTSLGLDSELHHLLAACLGTNHFTSEGLFLICKTEEYLPQTAVRKIELNSYN